MELHDQAETLTDHVAVIVENVLRLAHAILAVATDTSRDPEELKNQALQALAMNYQELLACFIRRNFGCDTKDGDEAVGFA